METLKKLFRSVVKGQVLASNCGNVQLEYFTGKLQLRYANGNIERGIMFDYGFSVINK